MTMPPLGPPEPPTWVVLLVIAAIIVMFIALSVIGDHSR